MFRGPLELWNHWSIQILVLLSLALQVMLFLLAGIRRREAHWFLRFLLWLAYLLADSTAIFALGHISLSGTPRDHKLVAFWAPFLLLHLGGPDNMTAYALQDNELWLRHLQILVVQVLGAAYVLYKQMAANGSMVLLATGLMFAIGLVKYVERTWALKSGDLSSMQSSIKKELPTRHKHFHPQDQAVLEEFILRQAHSLFHICKRAIVDSSVDGEDPEYHDTEQRLDAVSVEIWPLMEMELSFMYDILYTKAAVIHTWYGYCVRVISPAATLASLFLFQFSRKDGQSGVDVVITYVLLGGALLMETTALLSAVGSTWAYAFLCSTRWSWLQYEALCTARWDRLRRAVVSLRQLLTGGASSCSYRSRRWSGTMGQYNMLHFCTRRDCEMRSPLLGRLARWVGLEGLWNTKHYSGSVAITELLRDNLHTKVKSLYKEDRLNALGFVREKWGEEVLQQPQHNCYLEFKDYLGVEFQEGVIIWHIATDVFLARSQRAKEVDASAQVEAIKMMSNYMMFLLVERPYMLPGLGQNRLYQRTCENLVELQSTFICGQMSLKNLIRLRDSPGSTSRAADIKHLADDIYNKNPSKFSYDAPRIYYVIRIAKKLVRKEEDGTVDVLQLLFDVWIDFLVYAGNKGSRESHAKKLNSGGELTTILWLMAENLFQAYLEAKRQKERQSQRV